MDIDYNENTGDININGQVFFGFISEEKCESCGELKIYYDHYDALFCPKENLWLEGPCGDPKCGYCQNRPTKPLIND